MTDFFYRTFTIFLFFFSLLHKSQGVEFTFELQDSSKQCFFEVIEKDKEVTLEYQVVTGGQYDVDIVITDPRKAIIYQDQRKQYESFTFTALTSGEYSICFSNEFSTFSHKLVYFDLQVGEEAPLPGVGDHLTAMTQMETSTQEVHKNLNSIDDFQTHHRLSETQGRKRAEDLNESVMIWSSFVSIAILLIGFLQVVILKSFFSEKKPSQMYGY
ncbi:transmembrane emp24 domain-containing protein 3 [Lepeophtheirus salmonis]|uniref:Transmembrane emp24 domain-containing protein 3 n=1 Tax=Lepeophtheirus salmonis TaxID=72036 RepID=D3PHJ4_LEPSM|nr:transmembrane emp24 domain-containing protein 3-like isoform X2 [Lepeophtheirus salmonis]ADD38030.1 Transmembrane emp24 domain-containing protein 3 [Lepeophtheirus salmonis]